MSTYVADVLARMTVAGVEVEPVTGFDFVTEDPLKGLRNASFDLALVGVQELRGVVADELSMLAVFPRKDPRDALVALGGPISPLRDLPEGSRIGVSGARQKAFLKAHRTGLLPVEIDEGIGTELLQRELDAAVLGVWEARIAGFSDRTAEILDSRSWLAAPGRGMVAIMGRHPIAEITALDHLPTRTALRAELALLDALDTSRNAPMGCIAQPSGPILRLWAAVVSPDGRWLVRSDLTGPLDEPESLGIQVARELNRRGANILLTSTNQ